ncbi:MAG: SIR2 family NAD-dependent protein deacylase [Acidimicrobiales bacterium]
MIGLDPTPDPASVRTLLDQTRHLVVLTGAGISAPAGLPTLRGPSSATGPGEPMEPVTAADLEVRPADTYDYFRCLAAHTPTVSPTAAHEAIAEAQRRFRGEGRSFALATLNGDDLHERAGAATTRLHGSYLHARCVRCNERFHDRAAGSPCECGDLLRPDAVLLGESPDAGADWLMRRALRNAEVFLAVGMSGSASPVYDYARTVASNGGRTVMVTRDPARDLRSVFDVVLDLDADALAVLLEPLAFRGASPSSGRHRVSAP